MMKNLPETLAENLYRRLKVIQPNLRFVNWPNYPNSCVFEFNINGVNSQIYIFTYLDSDIAYEVFIREKYEWVNDKILRSFKWQDNGSLKRSFAFGQEQDVIAAISSIIEVNQQPQGKEFIKNLFRTYHPGYGNREYDWYQGVMDKIAELVK